MRSENKLGIVSASNEGTAYAYSAFVITVGLCIGIRCL